jgi:prepilin-type N-terminal cleavage/methylation domain-containing protein
MKLSAMPTPSTRPGAQRGYTLIEMLVVVLILTILVGIAGIPLSADGPAAALDLAEVQLQDAFKVAQTLSYSMGIPHGVVFDVAGDRMAVVALDGSLVSDPLTHGEYIVDFTRLEQPAGLDITAANFGTTGSAGIFDGSGVPVAGGTVRLGKDGVTRDYVLNAATGLVSSN